jgi:hypothetical protein
MMVLPFVVVGVIGGLIVREVRRAEAPRAAQPETMKERT